MLRTVRMLTLNLISVSPIKQNKTLFLAPENIKLCCKKVILVGECTPLQNSFKKTFPGPIRIFTVKENHIGSVVSEFLRYRQKHKQTTCYLYILFSIG